MSSRRIPHHPVLGTAPERKLVQFFWNDQPVDGLEGEPVAAALLARGERILRYTDREGSPRGIYCNIGHCYECRVVVDDSFSCRACLTPVRAGMRVARQGRVPGPPPRLQET